MKTRIVRASKEDVVEVARLFDLYRQFYECETDIDLAEKYISERIDNEESVIFIAKSKDETIGFVQLYPSFCSVDAVKIYILYDLYVDESGRNSGVGGMLMNKAAEYAKEQGASRLDLLTAISNKAGQHLYEKLGYEKVNEDFYCYSLEV